MPSSIPTVAKPRRPLRWVLAVLLATGCDRAEGAAPPEGPPSASAAAHVDAPPQSSGSASASAAPAPLPPRLDVATLDREPSAVERLRADLGYLASPELAGRMTGEPGAALAAKKIEDRFVELGLEPQGDAAPNGAARGYEQRFLAGPSDLEPPSLVVTLRAGSLRSRERSDRMIALSPGSMVVPDGAAAATVEGQAVAVGWGITTDGWDDYGGVDVRGRVVVVRRGYPPIPNKTPRERYELSTFRNKLRTARAHHAAGLVVVSDPSLPWPTEDPVGLDLPAVVIDRRALRVLAPELASALNAPTQPPTGPEPPRALPDVSLRLSTSLRSRRANPPVDVAAAVRACPNSPTADEWVVVGAHYDHVGLGGAFSEQRGPPTIHPGADDNASGTTLLLETARRVRRLPHCLRRNVMFVAFSGEELGLFGSRAWVHHPPVPLEKISGMINADMVGRLRNGRLDVQATRGRWSQELAAASAGLDLSLQIGKGAGLGRSDHESFEAEHVPVAFLFTGLHPDYHRPSDTPDKIEYEGLERITTFATRLVVAVAEREQAIPRGP